MAEKKSIKPNDNQRIGVLFVCLGNICRSPAAEGVFASIVEKEGLADAFYVDSAGTYGGHSGDLPDYRMRQHASARGYDLTHRARLINSDDFKRFDAIVTMDESNYRNICRMARTGEEERKILRMADFLVGFDNYDEVPDPYYEGPEGFELVLDMLEASCERLMDYLLDNITKQ